jgi:hypothetical protein
MGSMLRRGRLSVKVGGQRTAVTGHQLQHEAVGTGGARRNQYLEHRVLGMDVERQRRLRTSR